MVVLFLVFKGMFIRSSIVALSIYIPTNSARGFPFLHILSSIFFLEIFLRVGIPTPVLLPGKSHWWRSLVGCSSGIAKSQTRMNVFTFFFHFHTLEKEMATHFSVLAWRIPGMGEPGGLPSMGSHRVGHDWSDLAEAAAAAAAFWLVWGDISL